MVCRRAEGELYPCDRGERLVGLYLLARIDHSKITGRGGSPAIRRWVTEVLNTIESFSDVQNRLLIDLLEHEAAHQDQLIRYLYALHLTIPDSWKERYALA